MMYPPSHFSFPLLVVEHKCVILFAAVPRHQLGVGVQPARHGCARARVQMPLGLWGEVLYMYVFETSRALLAGSGPWPDEETIRTNSHLEIPPIMQLFV